jgi:hypothetical protein
MHAPVKTEKWLKQDAIIPQVAHQVWPTNGLAKLAVKAKALRNKKTKEILILWWKVHKITFSVSLGTMDGKKSFGYNNYDLVLCNGSNTGWVVLWELLWQVEMAFLANGEKPNRFPVMSHTQKQFYNWWTGKEKNLMMKFRK